jgi:hypothetical protein
MPKRVTLTRREGAHGGFVRENCCNADVAAREEGHGVARSYWIFAWKPQKSAALIASAFRNVLDKRPGFLRSSAHMKTTTLQLNSMNRSPFGALLLVLVGLGCFALAPQARATCQQGCDLTKGSTFLGDDALIANTWFDNTAVGDHALAANTSGGYNTAIGHTALFSNTTGFINTATGRQALYYNTTGEANTANGEAALGQNTTGSFNTGIGTGALDSNTTGNSNTAVGLSALFSNTTGSGNIALGDSAGTNNITGSNNVYIANPGTHTDANRIRIGTPGIQVKTFIAGISGATVPDGVGVIVGSNGQLGTIVSSERFKDEIKQMDKASEAILALKPVTFRYKHELDPDGIPQFGLVAEQVERVNPDLVARDEQGKPFTVRYEAVNAMLLNEFLKEHRTVQELKSIATKQEANAAKQEATIASQQKQIEALIMGLQKVSAQLEVSKAASRTVNNP